MSLPRVLPAVHAETTEAADHPAITAVDLARAPEFSPGLGASVFAADYAHLTPEDARSIGHIAFSKETTAVVDTGINSSLLGRVISHPFLRPPPSHQRRRST